MKTPATAVAAARAKRNAVTHRAEGGTESKRLRSTDDDDDKTAVAPAAASGHTTRASTRRPPGSSLSLDASAHTPLRLNVRKTLSLEKKKFIHDFFSKQNMS